MPYLTDRACDIIFYGTSTPPAKGGEIAHDGTNP